jgi:ABC-2 type transport system ATP-binding protein
MMAGLPNEVALRCNDPHALASLLMRQRVVDSARIADGRLTVTTGQPGELYKKLPGWLAESGLEVSEMHSADESLQTLFNSLMKMHRGEL